MHAAHHATAIAQENTALSLLGNELISMRASACILTRLDAEFEQTFTSETGLGWGMDVTQSWDGAQSATSHSLQNQSPLGA